MAYCCDVERKKLQNRISRIHGQVHSLKNKFDIEFTYFEGECCFEEIKRITPLKQIRKSQNGNTDISTKSKKIHKYTLDEMNSICGTEFTFKAHIIRKLNIRYKQLLKLNLVENNYSFTKDKNYIFRERLAAIKTGKFTNGKLKSFISDKNFISSSNLFLKSGSPIFFIIFKRFGT